MQQNGCEECQADYVSQDYARDKVGNGKLPLGFVLTAKSTRIQLHHLVPILAHDDYEDSGQGETDRVEVFTGHHKLCLLILI